MESRQLKDGIIFNLQSLNCLLSHETFLPKTIKIQQSVFELQLKMSEMYFMRQCICGSQWYRLCWNRCTTHILYKVMTPHVAYAVSKVCRHWHQLATKSKSLNSWCSLSPMLRRSRGGVRTAFSTVNSSSKLLTSSGWRCAQKRTRVSRHLFLDNPGELAAER